MKSFLQWKKLIQKNKVEQLQNPSQINLDAIFIKKDIYKKAFCYRCSNRSIYYLTITNDFNKIKKLYNKKI